MKNLVCGLGEKREKWQMISAFILCFFAMATMPWVINTVCRYLVEEYHAMDSGLFQDNVVLLYPGGGYFT